MNIESMSTSIVTTLSQGWVYLGTLKGLQRGGRENKDVIANYAPFVSAIWRATFDALLVLMGTLVDRTKATESLSNLAKIYIKYASGDSAERLTGRTLQDRLEEEALASLGKVERWRHKYIAHRTAEGVTPDFYGANQMDLGEVESTLRRLEEVHNEFSLAALNTLHSGINQSAAYEQNAYDLVAHLGRSA